MADDTKALQAKLLKNLQTRFNELADELKLNDEERAEYDTATEPGLESGIQTLRILKGRQNAWNEAIPAKEKGFFHPVDKRANGTAIPIKPAEQPPAPSRKFNMAQLDDPRLAPDDDAELEGSENTILRLYAYRDINGQSRFNMDGYKV